MICASRQRHKKFNLKNVKNEYKSKKHIVSICNNENARISRSRENK